MNLIQDKSKLFWILHVSGWIFYAVLMGIYIYRDVEFSKIYLVFFTINYTTGFILTALLRIFYRKIYDKVKSLYKILLLILIASFTITVLWELIDLLFSIPLMTQQHWQKYMSSYRPFTLVKVFQVNLLWFLYIFIWSVLYFGIRNWFAKVEGEIRAEKALVLANQATLQMLRYQINPHFLFNTLNTIQGLMYKDVGKADLMLTELSDLLRFSLKYKTDLFIKLKEEFEIIEKYLFIQKIRFENTLTYQMSLPQELQDRKILAFLIQPLVENAFKHGVKSDPYAGMEIRIGAEMKNEMLEISISNTGMWVERHDNGGTGIANVRERIENAYPGNHSLTFQEGDGQVTVKLLLPSQS
jgi:signal transduction histidine kinase